MQEILAVKQLLLILFVAGLCYLLNNNRPPGISDANMSALRTFSLDTRLFNPTLYSKLTKFWFNGLPPSVTIASQELVERWFGLSASKDAKAAFDQECHSGFAETLNSIGPEKFILPAFTNIDADRSNYPNIAAPFLGQFLPSNGADGAQGEGDADAALGLTLLLDQIPRNIFRGNQSLIYGHYDRIARAVFFALHKHRLDRHKKYYMSPTHRMWFYLPLEHSESLADHHLFSQNMEEMRSDMEARGDQAAVKFLEMNLSFGKRHSDILEKFGRYPYRNPWLGRETTDEEQKWLDEGGERFGA